MKKLLILLLFIPFMASASAGIGMSSTSFDYEELRKGFCYDIGYMVIRNMGDEQGLYKAIVTYMSDQPEKRTPSNWIVYTPQIFTVKAGEYEIVYVQLCNTRRAKKGDYSSFLEVDLITGGRVNVGVAVKYKFKVVTH